MYRKLTLLMALLLSVALLQASPVSPQLAQSIAQQHLRARTTRHAAPSQVASPTLVFAAQSASETAADYYVFNNGTQDGYVVIAGDDCAPSVLAYSDEGTFDPNNIPDGMRYMLDVYAHEIALLRSHPSAAPAARTPRERVVKPLVESNWDQNSPFNDQCPTYVSDGKTLHAATGCVATAAAQVMFFYQKPEHGTGSNTYECNVNGTNMQTLSADFEHTTYQWDFMCDDYAGYYSELQGSSVATLLYHIGVAAGMVYGAESSTSIFKMMCALRDHFGYNRQVRFCRRCAMTTTEWESLIYDELDKKHPILFGGEASNGAHAFVLDGYDTEGYVHVNWGWGGLSNGYFMLTALSPNSQGIGSFEGGYNDNQDIVIGLYPSQGEPEPAPYFDVSASSFTASASQVKLGEKIPMFFRGVMATGYGCPTTVNLQLMMFVSGPNGEEIEQNIEDNTYHIKSTLGKSYHLIETDPTQSPFYYTAPATLPNGKYVLSLFYKCPEAGVNEFRDYTHNEKFSSYIEVEVKDGVLHFSAPENEDDLVVSDIDYPAQVGTRSKVAVSATIHNSGEEYFDIVNYVITQNGQTVSTTRGEKIALAMGGQVLTKATLTAPATAGDYLLTVTDKDGDVIGGSYDLKVLESSGYKLSLQKPLTPTSYYMPKGNVTGSAQIVNNGTGNFVGTIPYMILDSTDAIILKKGESEMVNIPAGQTATLNVKSTFEGSSSTIYRICLGEIDMPATMNTPWGEAQAFMVSTDDTPTSIQSVSDQSVTMNAAHGVLTVSGASRVAVYNIAGMLMGTGNELRLPNGIYIVVADGTAHKVVMR